MNKGMMISNKRLKLSILGIAIVLFIGFGLLENRARAFSFGPPPSHTNAPGEANCTSCHTSFELNSGPGNVSINGLPATYLPNQEVMVSVTTFHPDGFIYGFQLTAIDSTGAQAGTLVATDMVNTQLMSGFVSGNNRQYISHTFQGSFPVEFNQRTWTFKWIAPATNVGPVTFYAAGNGGNGDHETTGDDIYATSATVPFQLYDLCLQDQSNGNLLQINLTTGEYLFSNCQGVTVGGTGTLIRRGCYVTLQHNSASGRLLARIDTCAKTGSASLQDFSSASTYTLLDKDTLNNTCACQ
jgi:hypothetical protein